MTPVAAQPCWTVLKIADASSARLSAAHARRIMFMKNDISQMGVPPDAG